MSDKLINIFSDWLEQHSWPAEGQVSVVYYKITEDIVLDYLMDIVLLTNNRWSPLIYGKTLS